MSRIHLELHWNDIAIIQFRVAIACHKYEGMSNIVRNKLVHTNFKSAWFHELIKFVTVPDLFNQQNAVLHIYRQPLVRAKLLFENLFYEDAAVALINGHGINS